MFAKSSAVLISIMLSGSDTNTFARLVIYSVLDDPSYIAIPRLAIPEVFPIILFLSISIAVLLDVLILKSLISIPDKANFSFQLLSST